jgi:hypothetical protein
MFSHIDLLNVHDTQDNKKPLFSGAMLHRSSPHLAELYLSAGIGTLHATLQAGCRAS